jgi:hypothetical protein
MVCIIRHLDTPGRTRIAVLCSPSGSPPDVPIHLFPASRRLHPGPRPVRFLQLAHSAHYPALEIAGPDRFIGPAMPAEA